MTSTEDNNYGCAGGEDAPIENSLRWAVLEWYEASHAMNEDGSYEASGDYRIEIATTEPIELSGCELVMTPPADGVGTVTVAGQSADTSVISSLDSEFGLYAGSQLLSGAFTFQDLTIIGDHINLLAAGADLTLDSVVLQDVNGTSDYLNAGIRIGQSPNLTLTNTSIHTHEDNLVIGGNGAAVEGEICQVAVSDSDVTIVDSVAQWPAGQGMQLVGPCDVSFQDVTFVDQRAQNTSAVMIRVGAGYDTTALNSLSFDGVSASSATAYFAGQIATDLTVVDSQFHWLGDASKGSPYLSAMEVSCSSTEGCGLTVQRSYLEGVASTHTPSFFYSYYLRGGSDTPAAVIENSTITMVRDASLTSTDPGRLTAAVLDPTVQNPDPDRTSVAFRNNTIIGESVALTNSIHAFNSTWTAGIGTTIEATNNVIDSGQCSALGFYTYQSEEITGPITVIGGGNAVTSNAAGSGDCALATAMPEDLVTVTSTEEMALGEVADNGGPTPTALPGAGSSLIDAGITVTEASVLSGDQRSSQRVAGAAIDVGAVEVQPTAVEIVEDESATAGEDLVFSVRRTGGDHPDAAAGVRITMTGLTAVAGVNYTEVAPTVLTWEDGDTGDQNIVVPTRRSGTVGETELEAVLDSPIRATLGAKATALGTIIEDGITVTPTPSPSPSSDVLAAGDDDPGLTGEVAAGDSWISEVLAATGANAVLQAVIALLLIGAGAVVISRRSRHQN